ncbi:MAG TPA: hypothetical protein VH877_14795 [Polyangia bacterium]|nr:hypothetical protein [Polyangia bacterium]
MRVPSFWPILTIGALWLVISTGAAQPAPPPSLEAGRAGGAGFHLEPRPAFETVFGDAEAYRRTVDRFLTIAERMQQRRDEFARAVQAGLAKLVNGGGKRSCPESEVAGPYGRALRLGQDYLRAGRELTRHYEQIKELDRLGESVGLTPDYRWKVRRALEQYQALLVDYREMKVAFHDQFVDELRYASCNLDRLRERADAGGLQEEPWPAPGQPGAPGAAGPADKTDKPDKTLLAETLPDATGAAPRPAKDKAAKSEQPAETPPTPRAGIFIFIDNTRCSAGTRVSLDGKAVAEVPAATRSAVQTTLGPHDLCLVPDGSQKKCGDAGTVRRSYLHDGWTISLRCN